MEASERISNAPAPTPVTTSAEDVLKELGVAGKSEKAQREAVQEHAWRLRPEEIGWLHDAGLTSLTVEVAELMARGFSETAAREAVAVQKGQLGPGTTKE